MTGAMYAAVSGMKSHMSKLNVIGNNIANVNTYGYKSARTTFRESIYSTAQAGSDGSNVMGGVNPNQYGYGVSVGTIDLDMSTKNYIPTGYGLDCMIDGDGFFLVGSKQDLNENGGQKAGSGVSGAPGPVDPSSLYLSRTGDFFFDSQGYLVDGGGNVVYGYQTVATTSGSDSSDAVLGTSTNLQPIRLPIQWNKYNSDGKLESSTVIFPDDTRYKSALAAAKDTPATDEVVPASMESITIDPNTGMVYGVSKADDQRYVFGYLAIGQVTNPNGLTHVGGPYYRAMEGAGDCWSTSIGGTVAGTKSSGETKLTTGGLESSGTDLATEFSEMISTQRGYQANTRIITVTDSMLEELVNIKR